MFQIQSKNSLRAALLLGASASIGLIAPAHAADSQIETVVVTGSLIPQPNATSNSPIQTVSAEAIDLSGHPNVEQVLNQMPQVVPSYGQNSNNPGLGLATVNLRGLNPIRTLVLVDGRRAMPTVIFPTELVDTNTIPASLVDHVDVVSGGGSATYGSDAIAGVVNFVLKKDFEGLEAQARYGQEIAHSFAPEKDLNFTLGVNSGDGKANVTIYGEFYKRSGVLQGQDPRFAIDNFGGSSTPPSGRVEGGQGFPNLPTQAGCTAAATLTSSSGGTYAFNTAGNPVEFCNKLPATSNAKANAFASKFETLLPAGNRYNFAPVNELVTPTTRHNLTGMGHYDIFPGVEAFAEFSYTNNVTPIQLAPTPITDGAAIHFVVTPNPAAVGVGSAPGTPTFGTPGFTSYISPAFQHEIDLRATTINPATGTPYGYTPFVVRWRSAQVGARLDTFTTNSYTGTIGLRGTLPFVNGWDWEAYYMQGAASQDSIAQNNVLASHLAQAMLSCPTGSGKGCVPIDIFGAGNLTPAMISFIGARTNDQNTFNREMAHAETHGNVGDYWGAGPISLALGAEWRKDGGTFTPDQAKQNFDILGFNPSRATAGSFNLWELFTEVRVPILSDMPFAEYVGFDGGARFSRYSGAGDVTTWKAGGEWQPIDDLRFRAMWQRAVRAPNINELFNGGSDGFPAVKDRCQGATGAVATACANQFAAVGVAYNPATFTQSNPQEEAVAFGNPNLTPEKSNIYTLGAVITPTFLPDVTFSADFWRISINNFIGAAFGSAQNVLDTCLNANNGTGTRPFQELDPAFGNACDLVTRTGSGDLLFSIPGENVNLGDLKTSGLDLQLNAQHELADLLGQSGDWGALDFSGTVSFLTEYSDPIAGDLKGAVDSSGIASSAGSSLRPNYRFTNRFGYTLADWRVVLTWYESGPIKHNAINPIATYNKFDLAVRWNITDQYAADLIVNNLFNAGAPLGRFSAQNQINTFPNDYDVMGTQMMIGLTAKL